MLITVGGSEWPSMVWGGLRPEPDVRRSTATLCIAFAFSSVRKQMKPQPFASPFHLFTFCSDNNSHFFTDGNCLYQALTENYQSLSPTSAFLLSFAWLCFICHSVICHPIFCIFGHLFFVSFATSYLYHLPPHFCIICHTILKN